MVLSTSKQMYIVSVILFAMAVLALIIFFAIGESDALFAAFASVSGGVFLLTYRAKIWNEKKIFDLKLNAFFLVVILFLVIVECISFYCFVYSDGENWLSKMDFFAKWGKFFVLLIPAWIITLILN
jgi:hypothetical protein